MSTTHRRPPTEEEQNILMMVNAAHNGVALMPIIFNGEERFGLIVVHHRAGSQYVQLLAVLPVAGDTILNGAGAPGSFLPPVPRSQSN